MKESISVSKKRLDLLLIPLCLFIYFKVYWFVYSFVAGSLLPVPLELLSILDILFGAFSCSIFLSSPLSDLKIFDKLKGRFSFLPQHLHQHAPQSQHQGAAGSGDDLGEWQKLHAFRAA